MKLLLCHPGASVSTADVYTGLVPELRRLGHECIPMRLDAHIQRAGQFIGYCYRHGDFGDEKPSAADVLYLASQRVLEMALRHAVDWVLVVSGMYLHPDWLLLLRRAGVPVAVLLTESPYDDVRQRRILPLVDLAWTNERASVAGLRVANPEVHYLPHAWSTDLFNEPATLGVPSHDVVFVGTGFQERVDMLSAVDWEGIDFGLYGSWNLLGSRARLRRHLRGGPRRQTETHALYRRAKIGLNLHRQSCGWAKDAPRITVAESLNPRAYELAAMGVFTISDERAEVAETFGHLVPTFRTARELGALVRRALADDWARLCASQALPACVAGATFAERAAAVADDLRRVGASLTRRAHAS